MMETRGARAVFVGLAAALGIGCGSFKSKSEGPTKAEVYAAVVASTAPDDDGDGLPNDVERRFQATLGTDSRKADSDGDGLGDAFEVFGASWVYLHSRGKAGTLPASDPALQASDPARDHTADLVDSDGDGVPDYLEVAGYRYDWKRARFVLDPDGFHTDPLQWSTDQDAYGDGMEVSGINMDVAVRAPGNHPLVPAYPDIVIELRGYTIALNEQVTDGSGGQLEKGLTWSREVATQHSSGKELGLTVGTEIKLGKESGFGFKSEVNAKTSSTDTFSEAVTTGSSFTEQVNWNRARSFSPAEAARIKLLVRIHNRGTAPASNLVPTIALQIAGADVASFEVPIPIYMLLPGAAYPPDPGTSLVLDRDGLGNPLTLTDWELRALQRGGPITLAVTQKRADVMRLTSAGAWEKVGDVNEYLARIVSVSARIALDVGKLPDRGDQARLATRLVYAGQGETAPAVTLRDALRWTDRFTGDEAAGFTLEYLRDDGTTVVPLTGTASDDRMWRLTVDPATMEAAWPYGQSPASIDAAFAMRLLPGSQISLRAPRPQAAALPIIHNAYAEPTDTGYRIVACASDYDAVARVLFVDKSGRTTEMARDGRGPWFYSTVVRGYVFHREGDAADAPEEIRVESRRTALSGGVEAPLTATSGVEVEYTPAAAAPIVRRATYSNRDRRFYARVEPGGPLALDEVDWVRLYHPGLTDGKIAGYRSLAATIFAFEDPYGWEVTLDYYLPGMRLVAHTVGGQYVARDVDVLQDLLAYRSGTIWLRGGSDDDWGNDEWWTPQADLDAPLPANMCIDPGLHLVYPLYQQRPTDAWCSCVEADPRQMTYYREWEDFLVSQPAIDTWNAWVTASNRTGRPDVYMRPTAHDSADFYIGFHVGGTNVADFHGSTAATYFDTVLGYPGVLALQSQFERGQHGGGTAEALRSVVQDGLLVFETTEGRVGKALVRSIFGLDEEYGYYAYQDNVRIDYVVYPRTEDFQAPNGLAYAHADALYAVGRAIDPANVPSVASGDLPTTYRLCAAGGTPCLADPAGSGLLPAGITFDARTGAIAGTPLARFPRTQLTVFGTNAGGETWTFLWIEVLAPPAGLAYAGIASCPTGYACTVQAPIVTGDVDRFGVSPALPPHLLLDPVTGAISGTPEPTVVTSTAAYRVTATNRAGSSASATLQLGTPLGIPSALDYPLDPYALTSGAPVAGYLPTHLGGPALWSVSPPLPQGLTVDVDTGLLYGTPSLATPAATYRITATNGSGSGSVDVDLAVQ